MSATPDGYAAATQPTAPEAIHTPGTGLITGDFQLPVGDTSLPAFRAMPDEGCLFPIVLVVQEIFGLHEYIKDVCRRFARKGYVAVAVQLFARAGDPSGLTDWGEIRKIVGAAADEQTMLDLDAAVAWTVKESNGDASRVGITGFCWGGRTVWLYSAHSPSLKAGVAWYGRLAGDVTENQPRWPVDVAGSLNAPVLGLYGGDDSGIPMDMVERMQAALKAADDPSEFVIYPGAPHAFHADYRDSYRPEASIDGERRMYDWFAEHGVA